MTGISIIQTFDSKVAAPIEISMQCSTIADRNNIPIPKRWQGMKTFVIEEQKEYILKGGLTNAFWTEIDYGIQDIFIDTNEDGRNVLVKKINDENIEVITFRNNEFQDVLIQTNEDGERIFFKKIDDEDIPVFTFEKNVEDIFIHTNEDGDNVLFKKIDGQDTEVYTFPNIINDVFVETSEGGEKVLFKKTGENAEELLTITNDVQNVFIEVNENGEEVLKKVIDGNESDVKVFSNTNNTGLISGGTITLIDPVLQIYSIGETIYNIKGIRYEINETQVILQPKDDDDRFDLIVIDETEIPYVIQGTSSKSPTLPEVDENMVKIGAILVKGNIFIPENTNWLLGGNDDVNDESFIGSTNDKDIVLKRNNENFIFLHDDLITLYKKTLITDGTFDPELFLYADYKVEITGQSDSAFNENQLIFDIPANYLFSNIEIYRQQNSNYPLIETYLYIYDFEGNTITEYFENSSTITYDGITITYPYISGIDDGYVNFNISNLNYSFLIEYYQTETYTKDDVTINFIDPQIKIFDLYWYQNNINDIYVDLVYYDENYNYLGAINISLTDEYVISNQYITITVNAKEYEGYLEFHYGYSNRQAYRSINGVSLQNANYGNNDAIFTAESRNKGILFPRLTQEQMLAIINPPIGLTIYNIAEDAYFYHSLNGWVKMGTGSNQNTNSWNIGGNQLENTGEIGSQNNQDVVIIRDGVPQININNNEISIANMIRLFGTNESNANYYDNSGVIIGSSQYSESSILTINSTNKGLLIPRLNNNQRDNVNNPINGLLIYNSEINDFQYYTNTFGWRALSNSGWSLSGNLLTDSDTQFIGSINNFDVNIRRNNILLGRFRQFGFEFGGDNGVGGTNSYHIGYGSGSSSNNTLYNNFIGYFSGGLKTNSGYNNTIGFYSGYESGSSSYNNFLGRYVGYLANGNYNNFIGDWTGYGQTTGYSNLIGFNVGRLFNLSGVPVALGNNNIIIGTNISLPAGTANALNLGNVLYGTNLYGTFSGNPSTTPAINGQIGIGVVTPHSSAILDVNTTNRGVLLPRLTTTQKNIIPSPATGLIVYDINENQFNYYDGVAWKPFGENRPTIPTHRVLFGNNTPNPSHSEDFVWRNIDKVLGVNNSNPIKTLDVIGDVRILSPYYCSTILDVIGVSGQVFSINDDQTETLLGVNDTAGNRIFEVHSLGYTKLTTHKVNNITSNNSPYILFVFDKSIADGFELKLTISDKITNNKKIQYYLGIFDNNNINVTLVNEIQLSLFPNTIAFSFIINENQINLISIVTDGEFDIKLSLNLL